MRIGIRSVALALCVAGVVAVAVEAQAWIGDGGSTGGTGPAARIDRDFAAVPQPERPAFVPGRPVLLRKDRADARFAPVAHEVEARRGPSTAAPSVTTLARQTADRTTNIVLVIGEQATRGRLWVHVRMPTLPNGVTGWVPRGALGGYQFVSTHLVVDRAHFDATLFRNGRPVFRARVGVGRPDAPTPSGEFYVLDKLTSFDNAVYGPVAFGTSARSAVLTDWPGGGFVGIHGTNEPGLIPGRISHGCIRMKNADILRLSRLMPVGTPVTVR